MRDNFYYINHQGEAVNFGGSHGIVIDENTFRDYTWNYSTQYGKVANFEKGIATKKLVATVFGAEMQELKNRMMEVFEKDVLSGNAGRVYINGYYLVGFFYASAKENYTSQTDTKVILQFVTDDPTWRKDIKILYRTRDNGSGATNGTGYPYGYPYDYCSPISINSISNGAFVPANMILTIYGACINPVVNIGNNVYQVNAEIGANEYLTIDTLNKTVLLTKQNGEMINCFALRNTEHYIFEKIPTGDSSVVVTPETNMDVTIIEERSEPKWI